MFGGGGDVLVHDEVEEFVDGRYAEGLDGGHEVFERQLGELVGGHREYLLTSELLLCRDVGGQGKSQSC